MVSLGTAPVLVTCSHVCSGVSGFVKLASAPRLLQHRYLLPSMHVIAPKIKVPKSVTNMPFLPVATCAHPLPGSCAMVPADGELPSLPHRHGGGQGEESGSGSRLFLLSDSPPFYFCVSARLPRPGPLGLEEEGTST